MTTVQSQVTDQQNLEPFFYLRISGLPYYFFTTIDPSSSRYGSFAWSAPTAYPAGWNRGGLMLPDDSIEQKFNDIIGGIATPGRVRLSVIDFPDPTTPGFGFFSRLFAPGRFVSDTSITGAQLIAGVHADSTTLEVRQDGATFTEDSDVYLGAETIGISTVIGPDGSGSSTLVAVDRNKYVCFGNTQDDPDTCWPPTPYHRIAVNPDGSDAAAAMVTTIPGAILGRPAALWMGHMRPDGNPEPETSSACLLLGRISSLDIGKVGGTFDITIDSLTADLDAQTVAPDLASATISNGIYLPSDALMWRGLTISISLNEVAIVTAGRVSGDSQSGFFIIRVLANTYTPESLAAELTSQLQAISTASTTEMAAYVHGMRCEVSYPGDGGLPRFRILLEEPSTGPEFDVEATVSWTGTNTPALGLPDGVGVLAAMGFNETSENFKLVFDGEFTSGAITGLGRWSVEADKPIPDVFVPMRYLDSATGSLDIPLVQADAASDFFTDQNDGSSKAYARYGDGSIVPVIATDPGSNTISVGNSDTGFGDSVNGFFYAPSGSPANIEQIAILVDDSTVATGGHAQFLGRLLASTTGQTQGALNVLPEGVGMGWLSLLTEADWLVEFESGISRQIYVDRTTKFSDIFKPIAREHGLFIMWDPSAASVRLRRIQIPQPANAETFVFSDSNRSTVNDRTSQRVDLSNIRTSWKIQPGWDWATQQWTMGPIVFNDVVSRSNFPNSARQESIEDKTLVNGIGIGDFVAQRFSLYGAAWTICQRTVNKTGMLLSPGTIHAVVDATMVNPYTGASGIAVTDLVYCFLTGVSSNPSNGETTVTFVVNSADDHGQYRQWSPTALLDFSATSNGYVNATKTLTLVSRYTNQAGKADGADFRVGDEVVIWQRDPAEDEGGFTAGGGEIATVSTDGITVTLVAGFGSVSSFSESIMVLNVRGSQTTDRKNGTHSVSWQGDGTTRSIDPPGGDRLNKWG